MSRAAALIWILIALILGLVVWFTTPRAVLPSASAQFLPDFSPAEVTQIDLGWPGGETARLSKSDSRWILQARPANVSDASTQTPALPPWPAESSRVQGLLRLIYEAREGADAQAMPSAIFLTLLRERGDPVRLAIDPNTLGGAGRIARLTSDGRVQAVAAIDEQFVRALESSAIESWRSKDLLYWPPQAITGFDSRAGTDSIELIKAGGTWIMQVPIAVKADAATVEGSLLLLSKSAVDRFLPAQSPRDEAWKEPARIIRLASRSNANTNRRDIEQTIQVGPAIDSTSRMVRITATDLSAKSILWGPEIAIVNSSTLEAIPSAPNAFISRRSLDLPAADIGAIQIESPGNLAIVKRAADGTFGAADAPIRDLLRLLCETPATQIRILESASAPDTGNDSIRIRALGPNSEPLGEFIIKVASVTSKTTGAPPAPALEIVDRLVARSVPWQRPTDFVAALRAIKAD